MLDISDIKTGKVILYLEEPWQVLSHEHSKTGRAGAVLRTKLKNLVTGAIIDKTFQGADKVDETEVSKSKAQYLYKEGGIYQFMDMESYEQFELSAASLGNIAEYLMDGAELSVINWNDRPLNVELPAKVTLMVVEAPPGIKGDTSSGGDKVVTLETGLQITTPLFVNAGDRIIINTEKGTYVSRA